MDIQSGFFIFDQMSRQVTSLVDHYFREEYGKAVSYLTAKYGTQNLELAEDSVQEALYKAMQTWPYSKIPNNPSGWIVTVASNKMIDHFRRASKMDANESIPEHRTEVSDPDLDSIQDDMVKMIFACCNPSLSTEYQIILTLKILGGLSVKEIARALIKKEETIAKAATRAKQKFKQDNIQLELPSNKEIKNRLNTVLQIIYLLFTEGYKTTVGDQLVKKELCQEAIRLAGILLQSEICNVSKTNALMALMHFHASRFDARGDSNGNLITLEHQDRSLWDKELIEKGKEFLLKATQGAFLHEYYLQATISGLHCDAKNYSETNWTEILNLYTIMLRVNPSPVIRLYRVVAMAKANNPKEALKEIRALEASGKLNEHHMFFIIKSEVLIDLGEKEKAVESLSKAILMTNNSAEKAYLKNKIEKINK